MGYRSVYEIMENGIIHCYGHGSARSNSDSYYQVGPNNVGLVRYLEYDGWDGERYYAGTNNPYMKVPVTAAEYYSIQNSYTFKNDLTWYPIGDLSGLRTVLQGSAIPVILNGVELACDQPPVIVGDEHAGWHDSSDDGGQRCHIQERPGSDAGCTSEDRERPHHGASARSRGSLWRGCALG